MNMIQKIAYSVTSEQNMKNSQFVLAIIVLLHSAGLVAMFVAQDLTYSMNELVFLIMVQIFVLVAAMTGIFLFQLQRVTHDAENRTEGDASKVSYGYFVVGMFLAVIAEIVLFLII